MQEAACYKYNSHCLYFSKTSLDLQKDVKLYIKKSVKNKQCKTAGKNFFHNFTRKVLHEAQCHISPDK